MRAVREREHASIILINVLAHCSRQEVHIINTQRVIVLIIFLSEKEHSGGSEGILRGHLEKEIKSGSGLGLGLGLGYRARSGAVNRI